jgi:hypothetical protein
MEDTPQRALGRCLQVTLELIVSAVERAVAPEPAQLRLLSISNAAAPVR